MKSEDKFERFVIGLIVGLVFLVLVLLLAGCNKEPESVQQVGSNFEVGRLFTTDGCTVYRFADGGRNVYFTNCMGSTSSSYQTSNGKYISTHDTEVMTSSELGVTK